MVEFEPPSGFYSVFSVTESPYVSSGGRILHIFEKIPFLHDIGKEMEFWWNDEGQV